MKEDSNGKRTTTAPLEISHSNFSKPLISAFTPRDNVTVHIKITDIGDLFAFKTKPTINISIG